MSKQQEYIEHDTPIGKVWKLKKNAQEEFEELENTATQSDIVLMVMFLVAVMAVTAGLLSSFSAVIIIDVVERYGVTAPMSFIYKDLQAIWAWLFVWAFVCETAVLFPFARLGRLIAKHGQ